VSIEGLLFLVFFVVVPLIQQWRRAQKNKEQARQPREGVPPTEWDENDGEDAGWEPPVRHPPPAPPPPPEPAPPARPPVPAPARDRPRDRRPSRPVRPLVHARTPTSDDLVLAARAARVHRRQPRLSAAGLRSRVDLRQAILQMTVLGPCRGNLPYGADRPDGSPSSLSP
jgi:hypothetical protein